MSLRQKLKVEAEKRIDEAVTEAQRNLKIVAQKHKMNVEALAKFVSGGKTKTIKQSVIRTMVKEMEDELIAKFNDQIDIEEKVKKAS